ncbi:MAG: exo-alpha-sialidase [Actinobacteria bacterium]|nr:exo-alpha-sialidase [Actinomycetota bacterium]
MSAAIIAVGTSKGAFVLRSDERPKFKTSRPLLTGEEVYSVAIDGRGETPRLFAGSSSFYWGSAVRASDDLGKTWTDPEVGNIKFPEGAGASVDHIWQVRPGGADEPGVVYAGVEPASLFRSDDNGETFALVEGLWNHPHRPKWQPGGGGLCLHTILTHRDDPQRLLVAISAAGVYRSDDRGGTWRASNTGIHEVDQPDNFPEYGQCVHKVSADPENPDRLYMQFHGGLFRSDDFGDKWVELNGGVPSNFGFPIVAHPQRRDTAYVIPMDSPMERWTAGGKCRVYRTTDAGESWEPLTKGLPQQGAYLAVLRDAFCTDGMDPAGLYFGTRSGDLYASADEGESWKRVATNLPPILSVRAAALD